jgi:transmembrane secretion effector
MVDLRPLSNAGFRHLAAALSINEFGNAIGEVALALLVFDRTGSAIASATLFLALRFFPALFAPLLTTYVEVLHPRVVLTVLYIAEAALFAAIASVAHRFSLPLVLALVTVDGVLAIVATTLNRSAITNNLVGVGLLREGNGLVNLGAMVAFAAGPVVAGALVAWHGASVALTVDAGSFLLTALVIASAPGLRIESDRETGTAGRFKAGMAILRTRPTVRRLLLAITITLGLASVAVPIEVVFAQKTLHAGSSGYGLLLTSWGAGMLIGGVAFTLGRSIPLMRILGYSTAMVAIGYGGLALSPTLAVACTFSFVGGTGNGAAWVAAMTAIQQRIPLTNQSAVMSVLTALNQVMPAVGFLIGGVVTSVSSPRVAYAISAVGTAAALATFLFRPINRVRLNKPVDRPIDGEESGGWTERNVRALSEESQPASRTLTSTTPFIG